MSREESDCPFSLEGSAGPPASAGGHYLDWSLGAAAAWKDFTLGVAYVDTNIDDGQALSVGATPDIVDRAIVVSLGASF